MSTKPEVRDEMLYDAYLRWGDYCGLCDAMNLSRKLASRKAQQYLCDEHLQLYQDEVARIKAGTEDFPPGLEDKPKEVYLEDETFWLRLRLLEAMAEEGEISESKADEQKKAVIALYNQGCETPAERKIRLQRMEEERAKKMLPRRRPYY